MPTSWSPARTGSWATLASSIFASAATRSSWGPTAASRSGRVMTSSTRTCPQRSRGTAFTSCRVRSPLRWPSSATRKQRRPLASTSSWTRRSSDRSPGPRDRRGRAHAAQELPGAGRGGAARRSFLEEPADEGQPHALADVPPERDEHAQPDEAEGQHLAGQGGRLRGPIEAPRQPPDEGAEDAASIQREARKQI